MNANQMFFAQRLRTAESNLRAAASRVPRIEDLAELMRAAHVSIPPELFGVIRGTPGYRTLHTAIAQRARELVEKDLAKLREMKPAENQSKEDFISQLQRAYGKLQYERWRPLRGNEPLVLVNACRSAEKIIAAHMHSVQ